METTQHVAQMRFVLSRYSKVEQNYFYTVRDLDDLMPGGAMVVGIATVIDGAWVLHTTPNTETAHEGYDRAAHWAVANYISHEWHGTRGRTYEAWVDVEHDANGRPSEVGCPSYIATDGWSAKSIKGAVSPVLTAELLFGLSLRGELRSGRMDTILDESYPDMNWY